jgi:hypothetical protein
MRIAVSSVSIAMLTPAQNPRGLASKIFIDEVPVGGGYDTYES